MIINRNNLDLQIESGRPGNYITSSAMPAMMVSCALFEGNSDSKDSVVIGASLVALDVSCHFQQSVDANKFPVTTRLLF